LLFRRASRPSRSMALAISRSARTCRTRSIRSLFSQLFRCLSRACLGERIVFIYALLKRVAFFECQGLFRAGRCGLHPALGQVREKCGFFCASSYTTEYRTFAKTGSGQRQEHLPRQARDKHMEQMIEKELGRGAFSQLVQHHVARDPSPAGDALRTCSGQLDLLFSLPLYCTQLDLFGSIWICLPNQAPDFIQQCPYIWIYLDLFLRRVCIFIAGGR
jgi:hypothetical protein